MPYAQAADSTQLHYTDWGDSGARPLLMVHGFGVGQTMWNNQLPGLLDADLRCVTFDRRGHGRSDVAGNGYDLDTLAADIDAVATHLDLSDAMIVAHSLGAAEAIRYLTTFGDGRIAGLVLSAPSAPMLRAAPDNPAGITPEVIAMSRQAMADDVGAVVQAFPLEDFLGSGHPISPMLADAGRRQFVDLPLQVLLSTFDTNAALDLRAEVTSIRVPVLILQGDVDKNNPLELTGRRCAQLLPNAKLVVLPGAGHGLYWSESKRFTNEITGFTQSLPSRRRA